MSLARLYARSSQFSSICKTLNITPDTLRCVFEVGQRRYNFAGASSSRRSQCHSFNKYTQLGIGFLKTPYYVSGSHHHYTTNVIQEEKSKKMLYYLLNRFGVCNGGGCTYAAVPLYRRFCQATDYGGTVEIVEEKILRRAQDGTVTNRWNALEVHPFSKRGKGKARRERSCFLHC